MTLTQNLQTSTAPISSYVVRKVVAGALATATIIALGFVAATQTSAVLDLISSVSLTSYIVVLVVAVGAISLLGARENVLEGQNASTSGCETVIVGDPSVSDFSFDGLNGAPHAGKATGGG